MSHDKAGSSRGVVRVQRNGSAAVITINHPPVNAMDADVITALGEALRELGANPRARALVLCGAGVRGFSAGADIAEIPVLLEPAGHLAPERIQKLAEQIEALAKPTIVAIHGYCLGAGLEVALACDIRIAAHGARMGLPEVRLGLLPGGGGTQRLRRFVGPGRARLMLFTGEPISAQQAYEWGLVDEVVPVENLLDSALALAHRLAQQSPQAIAMVKTLMRDTDGLNLPDGLLRERETFANILSSPDGREGVAAFLEKRPARWPSQEDTATEANRMPAATTERIASKSRPTSGSSNQAAHPADRRA